MKKEQLEKISFKAIVAAAIMIFIGIGLGSFVKYVVLLAEFGSFVLLLGIITYIWSQMVD